ncbi:MAG: Crp/Fnr family transcriptional regulator [Candidatus Nanopelagicales bacterium]|jgi:CRP-like cAMP-binding protein|nr:Crp/Fnr family transcriptional regulator [Candidatus Nanopelagicales bacterium]
MSNQPTDHPRLPAPVETDPRCGEERWATVADCRHCPMRQQALFSALRGPDFEHIFLPIRSAICPPGTLIYREDEPAEAVYTIRSGTLKLSKRCEHGGDRIVRILGRGSAAGLEALTQGFYWHTAAALREAELCRIPLAVFDELQRRNIQLSDGVIGQWEQQIGCADRWLAELYDGPVAERVRRLVRMLAELDAAEGQPLRLPLMDDLAAILGASRESVSRVVAELKREKVLKHVAPHTYECDLEALS